MFKTVLEEKYELYRKEKEYFNNKLSQVIYNPNRFKVLIGEDRFLFGIVSAGDSEAPLAD